MITFIAGLFTLWTLGFWIITAIASLLILILSEHDGEGWALIILAVLVGAVTLANPPIQNLIQTNPFFLIIAFFLYVIMGVVWSFIKWYFFLLNVRDAMKTDPDYQRNVHGTGITVRGRFVYLPVKAHDYKARVIGWMMYWPWSAFWTMIDDPIRRICNRLYVACQTQFQRMADSITKLPEEQ